MRSHTGDRGSRLGRLFKYAKAGDAYRALENFVTEAVAIAIAEDEAPLRSLLQGLGGQLGITIDWPDVDRLVPTTQEYVGAGAILDLVVQAQRSSGAVMAEVWIEVKVGAKESGNQLDAYRVEAAHNDGVPTTVLTLSPAPLRADVVNINWYELYRAASTTPVTSTWWHDLCQFLEEHMVASNALAPITDAEAGALGPAHDLLQKASAVLTAVHGALGNTLSAETAERMTWKNVEYLNAAAANVRSSGRFVTSGGPAHYGLLSEDGIAYWYVELRPSRRSTTRDEAVLNAAAGLSTDLWERGIAGSAILHARARATGFDSHAQAVEWILARLLDLDASGAFGAAE